MKNRDQKTSAANDSTATSPLGEEAEQVDLDQLLAWADSLESLEVTQQPENDAENINSEFSPIVIDSEDEEEDEQSASKRPKISSTPLVPYQSPMAPQYFYTLSYEKAFQVGSNSAYTLLFPIANEYLESQSIVNPIPTLDAPRNRTLPDITQSNFNYELYSISDLQELIRSNPLIFNLAKKLKTSKEGLMKNLSKFSYLDKNNLVRTLTYEKLRKWNDAQTKERLADSYHMPICKKQKVLIKNRLFLDVFKIIKNANTESEAACMLGVGFATFRKSLEKIKYKDKNNRIIPLSFTMLKEPDWNEEFARRIFGSAFEQPINKLFDKTFEYQIEPLPNNSEIDPLQFLYLDTQSLSSVPTSYMPLSPIHPVSEIESNVTTSTEATSQNNLPDKKRLRSYSFAHLSLRTIHQMLIMADFSTNKLALELNQISCTSFRYTLQRYLANYEYIDENGESCILNLAALKNWDEKKASENLGNAYDIPIRNQPKIELKDRRLKDIIKIISFNSETNAISLLGITDIELLEKALSQINYIDKNGCTVPLSYKVISKDQGYLREIFGEAVNLPLKKLFNETFPAVLEKAIDPADPLQFLYQMPNTNYISTSFLLINEVPKTSTESNDFEQQCEGSATLPKFSNSGQGFFAPADLSDQVEQTPPQNLTRIDAKLTPDK